MSVVLDEMAVASDKLKKAMDPMLLKVARHQRLVCSIKITKRTGSIVSDNSELLILLNQNLSVLDISC